MAELQRPEFLNRAAGEIDRLTKDGLADWLANFDRYTADLPLSWLDPMRDRLHLRRDELFGKSGDPGQDGDSLDAEYRAAVGGAA